MNSIKRESSEAVTTEAVTRMTNFGTQTSALAKRLSEAVWRNVDLMNVDSSKWDPISGTEERDITAGSIHRITPFCIGWLTIGVPKAFEHLKGGADWLMHARQVDLNLQRSKSELPPEINNTLRQEDILSEAEILLKPSPNAHDDTKPRERLYKAWYEADVPLEVPETELVISILDQMAGETAT